MEKQQGKGVRTLVRKHYSNLALTMRVRAAFSESMDTKLQLEHGKQLVAPLQPQLVLRNIPPESESLIGQQTIHALECVSGS